MNEFNFSYLEENDFVEFHRLLQEAYPDQFFFFYPERVDWLPRCENHKIPILVAKTNSQIIAWVWLQKSTVFINDYLLEDSFFSVNTFTLSKYRGNGVGIKLQKMASAEHQLFWSVSMSSANRRNRIRLGWHNGKQLDVYCLRIGEFDRTALFAGFYDYCQRRNLSFLKTVLYLGKKLGGEILFHKLINIYYPKWKQKKERNHITFKEIERYDKRWDDLFLRIRSNYDFGVYRDSVWMNWSYVLQPLLHFYKYLVYCNNKLIGTVVFRAFEKGERPHGIITELLVDPNEHWSVYQDILRYAVSKLSELRCQYIYLGASDSTYVPILKQAGFRCIEHFIPMYHFKNENHEVSKLPEKRWLLSLGDQDIAQYSTNRHPSAKQMLKRIFEHI